MLSWPTTDRCIACRGVCEAIVEAAVRDQRRPALGKLVGGGQHVDGALVQIDADAVAGREQRKAAVSRRLGRGVEDRERSAGTSALLFPTASSVNG